MTLPQHLVDRIVSLVRDMAETLGSDTYGDDARAIAADPDFPKPVDPDVLEMREIIAGQYESWGYPQAAKEARRGRYDDSDTGICTLAALKRRAGDGH